MKIKRMLMSVGAIASAFIMGTSPMTVMAYSDQQECICEEKCTEDNINEECEVCKVDYTCCEGKEVEHWSGSRCGLLR